MFHLILQLHHFVYLGNIRRSWYSEISPRIPFNPLPFFLSQVHRLRALSPFLLLLLLFVFFALSLSYQSTMAFHARSAISFLVRVLVHEIERDRKRQWLVAWLFSNGPARYVEAIVRAVLVWQWSSVSAGLIKARSSSVDGYRSDSTLWFIPTGYGTAWINDPLRALRHGSFTRAPQVLLYRLVTSLLWVLSPLMIEFVIKNFAFRFYF